MARTRTSQANDSDKRLPNMSHSERLTTVVIIMHTGVAMAHPATRAILFVHSDSSILHRHI